MHTRRTLKKAPDGETAPLLALHPTPHELRRPAASSPSGGLGDRSSSCVTPHAPRYPAASSPSGGFFAFSQKSQKNISPPTPHKNQPPPRNVKKSHPEKPQNMTQPSKLGAPLVLFLVVV
jgi:hypothetical protein